MPFCSADCLLAGSIWVSTVQPAGHQAAHVLVELQHLQAASPLHLLPAIDTDTSTEGNPMQR